MLKKQRIYDYFYEFASEVLHIVIIEIFVKSMTSRLLKLKVTHGFCFSFKIRDDPTVSINYYIISIYNYTALRNKVHNDTSLLIDMVTGYTWFHIFNSIEWEKHVIPDKRGLVSFNSTTKLTTGWTCYKKRCITTKCKSNRQCNKIKARTNQL